MDQRKSQFIYRKMLFFYSSLLLGIVLVLELNFIFSIQRQIRDSNLYFQQLLCRETARELEDISKQAREIQFRLYETETEFNDLINYLIYDEQTYLSKRLDAYAQSNKNVYDDKDRFLENVFEVNQSIYQISIISYENQKETIYRSNSVVGRPYLIDPWNEVLEERTISPGSITIRKDIGDVVHKKTLGEMKLSFHIGNIENRFRDYGRGELLIYENEENLLFCSNPDLAKELFHSGKRDKKGQIVTERGDGLTIVSYMEKKKAGELPGYLWFVVILAGVFLFSLGEFFVNLYVKRLCGRLGNLLGVMEEVKGGNLDIRIQSRKQKDELDIIGDHLNAMCGDLKSYIEKSYLAEIAQKNAEMEAMQSQINPHFLYNTLEAIRMKAITNGDREVGKMLYGLAVIFRSQIKEAKIITIAKELYYCKKYMELYEFRHQNRFHFEIECPDELMERPILKFVVQPIIENYFVHGIRQEDEDNLLKIRVEEAEDSICIWVDDNGGGMTKEAIRRKNKELSGKQYSGDSIGIRNVQVRIKAEFGDAYGVTLMGKEERGLLVRITIPKGDNGNV